jgi:(p)ppGpp synthase/HD superfamily hydrolase
MDPLTTVLRAAERAAHWHQAQRRKGAAREPYVNHLLEVARLVAEATEGRDPQLVVAALLHDAIEDQEIDPAAIAQEFGAPVAELVQAVTDDKSLPKQERKRRQVAHAPELSARAALLKLADKTSNLQALAMSPPSDWSTARKREYVTWARAVVAELKLDSPWLTARFAEAADAAERAAAKGD